MAVSLVLRLMVARRVMGAKSYRAGKGQRQETSVLVQSSRNPRHRAIYFETPLTKRGRSPVLGYNHNLRYGGRTFHVQTEDSGQGYARLYTHLFYEGTILSSKK